MISSSAATSALVVVYIRYASVTFVVVLVVLGVALAGRQLGRALHQRRVQVLQHNSL